ncbi:MAG: SdpI family protein [Ruminococcus sp.]|nr:SdpI family protein [Ruminococcus sp.]
MKKMKITKFDICTSLLTLSSMLPGLFVYSKLPDRIATHFSADGSPDGWSSKSFAVFGLPLILAALHIAACLLTSADERAKSSPKSYNLVRMLTPALAFAVQTTMVLYALNKLDNVGMIFTCLLAVLLIVVGNYLPKTRQNSFIGIRTPRTLSDEAVWNKVHRLAGFVWMVAGIVGLICTFAVGVVAADIIMMAALVAVTVYALVAKV